MPGSSHVFKHFSADAGGSATRQDAAATRQLALGFGVRGHLSGICEDISRLSAKSNASNVSLLVMSENRIVKS